MTINVIEILAAAGHAAASADNSQPWCLVWDGAALKLQFRPSGGEGPSPSPTNTATLLAMGGVLENIVQMGAMLGLDLVPEIVDEPATDSPDYASIPVAEPATAAAPGRDHPLFARHTNRFPYQAAALPAELKSELEAMAEGSAGLLFLDEADSIRNIADLIKHASEARFQVQEAHEWLAGSLRFTDADAAADTGLDIQSLDLPPGGAALLRLTRSWRVMSALNKLGAYKFMAVTDAAPVFKAPALIVVKASTGATGALAAGRLLTRAWIRLNERKIAVHPYYVITDLQARLRDGTLPVHLRNGVSQIEEQSSRCCGLDSGESLYMVLRVGYPQRTAPKSKRVPLATVFHTLPAVGS